MREGLDLGRCMEVGLQHRRVTSQQQGRRQLLKVDGSCLFVVLTIIDPVWANLNFSIQGLSSLDTK